MRSKTARYSLPSIFIHWALALISLVALGLGGYITYVPPDDQGRQFILSLHISLGITIAILFFIQIVIFVVLQPTYFHEQYPIWKKLLVSAVYILTYISMVLALASGYLAAAFSATPIQFWGFSLPAWNIADSTFARFLQARHGALAFVLGGLLLLNVAIVALKIFKRPGVAPRKPLLEMHESRELVVAEPQSLIASKSAQGLARNLRLFGWAEFWLQFVLALTSGTLLAFATSGRAFSPGAAGFGDAIYWGNYGFFILCFTVLLSFYYTRVARKLVQRPESWLSKKSKTAFWFLAVGALASTLGIIISFTGVALSVALLIAKTVSQPPGIAITDPSKIIRALDVFILLLNFILLMGHLIGAGVALWLSRCAIRAHFKFIGVQ
jgi:cytochrome b561